MRARTRYGATHFITLGIVDNLASCLDSQGRYAEAEPLYRSALEAMQRVHGEEHPATLGIVDNLASCLYNLDRYAEAEALHRSALEAMQRVQGEEHPSTLNVFNNLASCLGNLGLIAESDPIHLSALQAMRRVQGEEHPGTLNIINCLAGCLGKQSRYATRTGRGAPLDVRHRHQIGCLHTRPGAQRVTRAAVPERATGPAAHAGRGAPRHAH